MQVKKERFVFKTAYRFMSKDDRPNQVNICRLFWRFILHLFILIPGAYGIFGIVVGSLYVAGFLFCHKPDFDVLADSYRRGRSCWISCEKWPTIGGHRIWPATVLAIIGISLHIAYKWQAYPGFLVAVDSFLNRYLGRSCYLYLPLISTLIIWLIYRAIRKTEFWFILTAYLRAKKDKLCFTVDAV